MKAKGEIVIRLQTNIDFLDESIWLSGEPQIELAAKVNVQPGTLSKYKSGNLPIPLEVLISMLATKTGKAKPFRSFMCTLSRQNRMLRMQICTACGGCLNSGALDRRQVVSMVQTAVSEMAVSEAA